MSFATIKAVDYKIKCDSKSKKDGYSKKNSLRAGYGASVGQHLQFLKLLKEPNDDEKKSICFVK